MAKQPPADQHIDGAKRRLAHLGGLAHKTAAAEQKIVEAARDRLAAVDADLAKLRPRAITDQAAGDSYQALILERGQIATVIAKAAAAGAT